MERKAEGKVEKKPRARRRDSFEVWWDKYVPTGTPTEGSGGPNMDDEQRMFETYGKDLDTIYKAYEEKPEHVWTLVECEGKMYISAGYHWVNRMGYYLTEKPWTAKNLEKDIRV